MRQEYEAAGLRRSSLDADPLGQFQRWLDEAVAAEVVEPNAMVLATVDEAGAPQSRHVLLKGLEGGGFEFYTNYESTKSSHLAANPRAALSFGWLGLHRQVNVVGSVDRLPAEASDEYFALRPREAQLGAWASPQSRPLTERSELDDRLEEARRQFAGRDVPRPPHWGGFRLVPDSIEFWQGRPSRLHDRFRYQWLDDGWLVERLAP